MNLSSNVHLASCRGGLSLHRRHRNTLTSRRQKLAQVNSSASTVYTPSTTHNDEGYDLILSSGFLAFASHCGFLQAVEDVGLPVNAVMGTSAGALIGSMYSAGYTPKEIAEEFSRLPPIKRVSPCFNPFVGGFLSLNPVVDRLTSLLPETFDGLKHNEFACAVVDKEGNHLLVQTGSPASAVTASACVPVLFHPMPIDGIDHGPFIDGGMRCRIGLDLWREKKYENHGAAPRPAVVHLIGRSSPFSGNDDTTRLGPKNVSVVHSPKSGASLWDLTDFDNQFEIARERAVPLLKETLNKSTRSTSKPLAFAAL